MDEELKRKLFGPAAETLGKKINDLTGSAYGFKDSYNPGPTDQNPNVSVGDREANLLQRQVNLWKQEQLADFRLMAQNVWNAMETRAKLRQGLIGAGIAFGLLGIYVLIKHVRKN